MCSHRESIKFQQTKDNKTGAYQFEMLPHTLNIYINKILSSTIII